MSFNSFTAIVPIACIVAAALAAMVAEAFREPGERMPIAPLGAIGLIGAGASALIAEGINVREDLAVGCGSGHGASAGQTSLESINR